MEFLLIKKNALFKLVKLNVITYERIHFFKQCLINKVVPNFLKLNDIFHDPKLFKRIVHMFQVRALKKLISINYSKLDKQKREIKQIKNIIKINDKVFYNNVMNRLEKYKLDMRNKMKDKYDAKLLHLCLKDNNNWRLRGKNKINNESDNVQPNIINKSKLVLSDKQIEILAKGPKYIPPCKKINKLDILTDLECGLNRLKINSQFDNNEIKNSINIIKGKFNKKFYDFNKFECNKNLTVDEKIEINEIEKLRKLRDKFVFTKPDKHNNIIILDKAEYVTKMEYHLNKENLFNKCNRINVRDINNDFIKFVKEIMNNDSSSIYSINDLVTKNPIIPTPYGLPKINKPDMPVRVIIPAIGSLTYNLSKFLYQYLVNDIPYFFKKVVNAVQIKDEITKLAGNGYKVTKFDVVALYDNIPLEETFQIIIDNHNNNNMNKKIKMNDECLRTLLMFIKENNYCSFNGSTYRQIDGMPMGSPISSVLSESFMVNFENMHIKECGFSNFKWFRYVDDILILHKFTDRQLSRFVNYINNLHNNIKFTREDAINNKISFLDLEVEILEMEINTGIYHKNINNQIYINWGSGHTYHNKIGLIYTLINRAYNLCNNNNSLNKEIDVIIKDLVKNKYPYDIIVKTINNFLMYKNKNIEHTNIQLNKKRKVNNNVYIPMLYYDRFTNNFLEPIKKAFRYSVSNSNNIKFAYRPGKNLSSILKHDDKNKVINDKDKVGCIYRYDCQDCNETYIGETQCKLKERVLNHRNKNLKSHIYDHYHRTNHKIITNKFEILELETDNEKRKIKETYYIKKYNPSMNGDKMIKLNLV